MQDTALKERRFMSSPGERKIVVVTPVKNEQWILETFLAVLYPHVDHIVIGDHFSTDESRDIAKRHAKVTLVSALSKDFSEAERRQELLDEARKFGPNNLIIALDADEILTPEFWLPENLSSMMTCDVGTRFTIPHFNVLPGFEKYWPVNLDPIAFIDDGFNYDLENRIHFPRVPLPTKSRVVEVTHSGLLHLQYINWARMESKHRWYRVWERINFPDKSQLEIHRRYSHMYHVPSWRKKAVPQSWLDYFQKNQNIDLRELENTGDTFWWDADVVIMLSKHPSLNVDLLLSDTELANAGHQETRIPKRASFDKYLSDTSFLSENSWFLPFRLTLRVIDYFNREQFR
jgi:glycosyltransferase involved in cell wall biosynthesis